ncbi:MAG: GAF domain-containing protein, partial [Hormoscilla sp.]
VPIFLGETLWGLLAAYQNSGPRAWQVDEVELLAQIGGQLGVALQQGEYLKQMRAQAAELAQAAEREKAASRQKALTKTVDKIRQSLDIDIIFATTTGEVRQLLEADRVAIYRFYPDWSGEFVAESLESGWTPLLGMQVTDTHFQETSGGRYVRNESLAVNDIYQVGHADCHVELLETFEAKAYIIAPILQGKQLWGLLAAYQNSGPRDWEAEEVDLLAQIGTQLGVAIQQAEYLKQVEAQAAQLAKAAERQRALATTVEKIRQSLDIDAIFETTTQEVRRLLQVERVAIYRFYSDWSGEFVADSLVDDWTPVVKKQSAIDQTVLKTAKGSKYPRNETFVPILQGTELWGLLMASQTSQPRYWQDEEINLLTQVGVQLGVALQQAELLDQTRQQAQELVHALEDLQQTQSQMIQNEKMASLGQLVAGVAHEINNPVSFIYGNLVHVSEYTQDLLSFVQLYQKHYPDPTAEIQELAETIDLDFMIEDLPKTLASMQVGADRIRQIVLSLRNFSRLDEAEMKPVNIHEGMESTLLILQNRLKGNGNSPDIALLKEYGELPEVPCHAAQLNQVFMNIISNAIDALSESATNNPQIIIRTEVAGDRVLLRIADNGPGMPQEVRSRIFDPFFTTKPVGKGTGLGLSISYKIVVEKHKGKLKCTSKPGEGTEFAIEIPIKE